MANRKDHSSLCWSAGIAQQFIVLKHAMVDGIRAFLGMGNHFTYDK